MVLRPHEPAKFWQSVDIGPMNKIDSEVLKERSKRVKKGGSNRLFQKSISEGI